ncbi:MAG: Nif3-like dinuclear metal center hexameric protein [Planctomycetota bacterium]|jgi:dinuclear metal center YbgI/SA1388 family protein
MQVSQIIEAVESIAPPEYAAAWDNVGLLVGARDWDATALLLATDLTDAVLKEAIHTEARMVVSYHPPIFDPLRAVTDATPSQRVALMAARGGVAIYSPHTALDAAPGGLNDWIAAGLGAGDVRPLEVHRALPPSEQYKLVTFCPADAVDRLRNALALIGAGRIGRYELCSFEMPGTGTFFGGTGAHPRVGRAGALERVDEIRLEMVCSEASLALAVSTLRQFHPYEEPPIEIYRLQERPQRDVGQGRKVVLDEKVSLRTLVERIKRRLGVEGVSVAVGDSSHRRYGTIGLCAGAGGSLRPAASRQGCEAFLTGEMRHHDVLAAQADGCTVVLAGHTASERGYLKVLRKRLLGKLPGVTVAVSRKDTEVLRKM